MDHTYADESQNVAAVPIGTAAAQLGVSVDTLRRWADEGRIACSKTLGGQRRFAVAEIERVKAEMRAAS